MKTIILFLMMLPLACSPEDPEEEPVLQIPDNAVFLSVDCPDQTDNKRYFLTDEEFAKVNTRIRSENVPCIFMTITTYEDITVSGYYAGQSD